jgi:hypothetical protein
MMTLLCKIPTSYHHVGRKAVFGVCAQKEISCSISCACQPVETPVRLDQIVDETMSANLYGKQRIYMYSGRKKYSRCRYLEKNLELTIFKKQFCLFPLQLREFAI